MPFLYNSSSCWMQPPKKALNLLDSITHSFFRSLFKSSKGNPLLMYYWDTKSLQTENILMMNKLLFLWHLSSLPHTSLAGEIYSLQRQDKSLPSVLSEFDVFLGELNIHADPSNYSKKEWKRLISSRVHERNKNSLIQQLQSSRKLDIEKISSESYEEMST